MSKASRMSTQSNLTFMSEDISTAETDVNEDYGVSLSIVETEKPVKAVRGRKRGKAKKPPSKSKAKPMKTSVEEAVQNSSFIEAEDDDFEVKVGALPKITKKGKKRTSDEMDKVNEAGISNPTSSSGDNRNRPAKRRATRTRGSAIHVENALAPSPNFELDTETYASDAENTLTAGASVSRKGIKRGRKKASSTSRKTSAKSTASIASLRSVPSIEDIHDKTPLPSMRPVANSVQLPSTQKTPRLVSSPQSSDVENKPPSSRPSITRPPCSVSSPPASLITRAPLAASTPVTSPSRPMDTRLQSSLPWVTIDLEKIFLGSPIDKENDPFVTKGCISALKEELRSPEKKLTVEEWIQLNAKQGEENLRNECERLVGKFEGEGVRALRVLEGIVCND